jgi:hypothetical protein
MEREECQGPPTGGAAGGAVDRRDGLGTLGQKMSHRAPDSGRGDLGIYDGGSHWMGVWPCATSASFV